MGEKVILKFKNYNIADAEYFQTPKFSRYTGEQRMYVIFVDATSANGLFEHGLNAILVSRSTLLNSKINTSIFNFNPSSPGEMEDFKGASFYAYDNSKASQKAALVGAVTVTLSGDKATL